MLNQANIDALRAQVIPPQGHLIDGAWVEASDDGTRAVQSPIDGAQLTAIAEGTPADVDAADASAKTAFENGRWSRMAPVQRKQVPRRFADLVQSHTLDLAVLGVRDYGTEIGMQGDSYTAQYHILTGSATDVRDDRKILHLADIDAMKGRWTDIMIHLDTANGNDLLEVYVNGERKAAMSGFINFIPSEYYFKYGIYRSFVSKHGGPMPTQFVVIDEVRMGRTAAEVKVYEDRPVD